MEAQQDRSPPRLCSRDKRELGGRLSTRRRRRRVLSLA